VVQAREQLQVLAAGEQLVHGGVLRRQADPSPHRGALPRDVMAADGGRAAVGWEQGGQDPHGGGLAGAVGAQQGQQGAGGNGQVHPGEHLGAAEGLAQPSGVDHWVVHHWSHLRIRCGRRL
jgi:hypothetical protein